MREVGFAERAPSNLASDVFPEDAQLLGGMAQPGLRDMHELP